MSVKNCHLDFDLKLPDRLDKAALPIEVRSSDRRLVGRFDSNETVDVEPGSYYVSVRLPSGDELTDWVEIEPGTSATAHLAPDIGAGADADGFDIESQFILTPQMTAAQNVGRLPDDRIVSSEGLDFLKSRRAVSPDESVGIRAWRGTLGNYHPFNTSGFKIETKRGTASITVPSSPIDEEQTLVQLIVPNRPGIVVVVPHRPHGPAIKVVVSRTVDELVLDAHLTNELADVMIRDTTEVDRTKRLGDSMQAKGLLKEKADDPIAAAAGAVTLLGIDEGERVHSWLRNLAMWIPWLADGPAVAAESCARQGNHGEAVEMLLLLKTRGLPLFADSLAFAVDRLGRYARSKEEPFGDREQIAATLRRLRPYAEFRVPGKALTTFKAIDPNEPSDKPFDAMLPPDARPIENVLQHRSRTY